MTAICRRHNCGHPSVVHDPLFGCDDDACPCIGYMAETGPATPARARSLQLTPAGLALTEHIARRVRATRKAAR